MAETKTNINFIQGSVFNTESYGLDAVIVFIPCGFTAIRIDCIRFVKQFGEPLEQFREFFLYKNNSKEETGDNLRYILIDRNKENKIYSTRQISIIIDFALNEMSKLGVKRIGMNGIRARSSFPEMDLYLEIKKWLVINKHDFHEIYLIDKRGGFNRIK